MSLWSTELDAALTTLGSASVLILDTCGIWNCCCGISWLINLGSSLTGAILLSENTVSDEGSNIPDRA